MFLTKAASVSGTFEELSQKFGCRISQVQLAVQQLKKYKVAEVFEHNGNIILTSRRAERDCKIRGLRRKAGIASGTKRQQRSKNDGQHTSSSTSSSMSKEGCGEPESNGCYHPHARTALHWLNQKAGKSYRELHTSLSVISDRLEESGVDIEGVKRMIEHQCKCWLGTSMATFLRPTTLFSKEKFDAYYGDKDSPVIDSNHKPKPSVVGMDIVRYSKEISNFDTSLPE